MTGLRAALHKYIPAQFHDPFGLALRLLRTRDPAATYAMTSTALGVLAMPADLGLSLWERRLYARAEAPAQPMVFVCGPPRSGTTVTAQTLIKHLPVRYFNNLTSIFPRSPVTANRIHARISPSTSSRLDYHSYYGKSTGLTGPNDAIYLWDRWLGATRTRAPRALTPGAADAMRRFFGAFQAAFPGPLIGKNNNLNACAALVAEQLPGATFICMAREPRWLAQALLKARLDIHGSDDVAYGLDDPDAEGSPKDPVEAVCAQTMYHERLMAEQQSRIGPDRYWIVDYETFCANPRALVRDVARRALGLDLPEADIAPGLAAFTPSRQVRIDAAQFDRIERELARLHAARPVAPVARWSPQ